MAKFDSSHKAMVGNQKQKAILPYMSAVRFDHEKCVYGQKF